MLNLPCCQPPPLRPCECNTVEKHITLSPLLYFSLVCISLARLPRVKSSISLSLRAFSTQDSIPKGIISQTTHMGSHLANSLLATINNWSSAKICTWDFSLKFRSALSLSLSFYAHLKVVTSIAWLYSLSINEKLLMVWINLYYTFFIGCLKLEGNVWRWVNISECKQNCEWKTIIYAFSWDSTSEIFISFTNYAKTLADVKQVFGKEV